jgi:hypothetical protein
VRAILSPRAECAQEATMRVRLWLLCSLFIAATGCRDSGRQAPTLPVVAAEARPITDAAPSVVRETLAARRAKAIEELRAYRLARVYPTDAAGMPLGVFRDDHGVRCPMSELIYQSGRTDLVDAVVRLDNDMRLADVHGGPLFDWMLQSGMTQEEIVEVQGAMELDYYRFQVEATPQDTRLVYRSRQQVDLREAAFATVDAKLLAAERMLRAGTANSLATAVDRLAERRAKVLAATRDAGPGGGAGAATHVAAR